MNILAGIFSWPFGIGVLIGLSLDRAWRYAYTGWLNQHHPLPDGQKRRPPRFNFTALGVTIAVAVILFSVYKIQDTSNTTQRIIADARAFSAQVQDCQRQLIEAIKGGRQVSAENDALSVQQRDLFAAKDDAETNMWRALLTPPDPAIAQLDTADPRRQHYSLDVLARYTKDAADIDRKIRGISDRQTDLLASRPPLPEPTCGK